VKRTSYKGPNYAVFSSLLTLTPPLWLKAGDRFPGKAQKTFLSFTTASRPAFLEEEKKREKFMSRSSWM
jgi:hypothetical protein